MSAATCYSHISVLLNEALEGLAIQADGLYIDGTFGRGGHSRALLAQLGPEGRLIAFDKDPEAIRVGDQLAAEDGRFVVVQRSFAEMAEELRARGLAGQVQGVLLDLGVSSPQLDDPTRGFSFLNDGPLDMRMNPSAGQSAADWINSASEADIATVLNSSMGVDAQIASGRQRGRHSFLVPLFDSAPIVVNVNK